MKYLTIDTTTKVTAVSLAEDGCLIAESFLHTSKTHSERLIPMLDQLLKAAALDPARVRDDWGGERAGVIYWNSDRDRDRTGISSSFENSPSGSVVS